MLKYLNVFSITNTTHSLLVFPRLWMTLLSLANDAIIYKLAYHLYCDANLANVAAILYSSSYTSWVFCTRTFSNCIETTLFGILLLLVTSQFQNSPSSNSTVKNVNFTSISRNHLVNLNSLFISIVVVAGVFIRISFAVFMIVPLLYWLLNDIAKEKWANAFIIILTKCLALLPGALCTTIFFILCDFYYFNSDAFFNFPNVVQKYNFTLFREWFSHIPLTPLNLFQYNTNTSNIEKHGVHPWFLHATVNLPLMFTPLVFILIPALTQMNVYFKDYQERKHLVYVLAGSFLLSLGGLSSFSHQEPRYILPLVVPITILISKCFYPLFSRKLLLLLWLCFNVIYFIFFALLHQGGVVPSMEFVNSLSKAHSLESSDVEIVYYKTYMPPLHLAALDELPTAKESKFKIRDLAGSSHDILEENLKSQQILMFF